MTTTNPERTTPPWLLAAKVTAPERTPGFFRRAAITDRVEPFEYQLLVLKAPTGFGKTTLLTDLYHAARETGVLTAWITLDEDDTPSVFADYLLYAFERAGLDLAVLHNLRNTVAPAPQHQQRIATVMRAVERHAAPCLLVLDEAERLADPGTVAAVESLVRHASDNLRVAVGFRENPGFDVSQVMLRGRGLGLTEADLRFSTAEIAAFFGGALSRRDLATVAERTEGWPAALQIYRNQRDAGRATDVSPALGAAVADYCNARLLRGVPEPDREFALDLALFDWIDPELVDEVMETTHAVRRLDTLSGLSGFLATLDDGNLRRLHPLIAEYCAAQRLRTDPERFRDLHRRLALAMEARGRLRKAMRHARAAGDARLAGEMLERAGGLRVWRRGGSAQLEAADRLLTADALAAYPRLALARCLLRIREGKFDEARTLYEDVRRRTRDFVRDREGGDDRALGADAFIVKVLFAGYGCQLLGSEAVQSLFAKGHELARDPALPAETRGALHELLAIAYFQMARFDTSEALGARAAELFARTRLPRGAMNMDFILGMLAMAQGRVQEAAERYARGRRKAEEVFPRDPSPALIGDILAAELALEGNNVAEIEESADGFPARLRGTAAWLDIYAAAFALASELAFVRRGPKAALAFLDESHALVRSIGLPSVTRYLSALRITVLVRNRREDRAGSAWQAAGLPTEGADVLDLDHQSWREMEAVAEARVRLLTARREFDRARELVDGLCRVAAERRLARTRLRGLALALVVEHRAGARDAADSRLARYLRAAATVDYTRPLVRDRAISVTVLRRVSETHPDPDTRASAAAMTLRLGRTTAAAPDEPASPVAPSLSARERAVLEGVAHGNRDKEIGAALGLTSDGVRYHLTRVYRKLHAANRGAAIRRARELGILS